VGYEVKSTGEGQNNGLSLVLLFRLIAVDGRGRRNR
jgi:hypothetical protein